MGTGARDLSELVRFWYEGHPDLRHVDSVALSGLTGVVRQCSRRVNTRMVEFDILANGQTLF